MLYNSFVYARMLYIILAIKNQEQGRTHLLQFTAIYMIWIINQKKIYNPYAAYAAEGYAHNPAHNPCA